MATSQLRCHDVTSTLVLYVNGKKVEEHNPDPEVTLLSYLRNKLRLVGSKLGCGEGGCGACTVMISRMQDGDIRHFSVTACLCPLVSLHGAAVTTIEALGSARTRLHPLQERLAKAHASQCGFCTPGFVMSAYALLRSQTAAPTMEQMEEAIVGNLCRCTGYRPILEGLRSLTVDSRNGCGRADCCKTRSTDAGSANCSASEDDLQMTSVLFDPATCAPYDPTQELIFPPELKLSSRLENQPLHFSGPRVTFFRVNELEQLLVIKKRHPEAKIVVGNTEVGVDVRLRGLLYPVLVSVTGVQEMLEVKMVPAGVKAADAEGVVVGAAVTLTRLEEELRGIIKRVPEHKARVFAAILEMLRWFAGKQIRNVASLGGNIMTCSPISDINPILLAAAATLHFRSHDGGARSVRLDGGFFTGYRRCAVQPEEVLVAVTLPCMAQNEHFYAFKQARRRDDDIAIVNAAFCVKLHPGEGRVEAARLAFGGVAATTVLAERTAQMLVGKDWGDERLLPSVIESLIGEVEVTPSAPGGMTRYRNTLVPSFFFKFYVLVRNHLNMQLPHVILPPTPEQQDLLQAYARPPHAATHVFQKVSLDQEPIDPVGRPLPHASAVQQVTGEAIYVDDIPRYENELFAAVVVSTKARAKIVKIDPQEALALQGVHSFISAKDLPEENNKIGVVCQDEQIFASEEVDHVGQIIGVILADTRGQARRASKLVAITYEETEKPIITIEEAIEAKSWHPPLSIWNGDVSVGHKEADHTIQGEIRTGGQEHFYLEPNAHIAVPGECDSIELISSTQSPTLAQNMVCKALGLPANKVVCRTKRMGGGFGGKETRANVLSVYAAIAANRTGRPVRLVLERHDDMLITGTRHPFLGRWKASFSKEGKLKAVEVDLFSNAGCSSDLSLAVMERALLSTDNAYMCPNVRYTGHVCRTNLSSNTAFRGFGCPQAVLVTEDMMFKIAAFLGKDPAVIRELNLYNTGDETPYGLSVDDCTLRRCWHQVLEQAEYSSRKEKKMQYNKTHQYRKRGLAATALQYGIGYNEDFLHQAAALVHIYTDGSVLLTHGGTEMGQGLHTKMIQVASRALGVSVDKIHVAETSTDKVPNTTATSASTASDMNGEAVLAACDILRERLSPYKAKDPEGSWTGWVSQAYMDRVQLSATGFHKTPDIKRFDFEKQKEGRPWNYFCYGAAVSEVEVDCLTGDHTLLRTDIVMDVGKSLNPAIDIGQVEGGFLQGLGLVTLEELRYTPAGVLLTKGPGAYKLPGVSDIPCQFNVTLLRDAPNKRAVYSSKAVGEPPLISAISVFQAIRDAVGAARRSNAAETGAGDGEVPLWRLDCPATAERIRMACEDCFTKQVPSPIPGTVTPWDVTV